jgi:flagellar FliJ protein
MAFRFPLAAVLRFRKSLEHHEELRLLAANQEVAQARQRIAQVDEHLAARRAREAGELQSSLTAAELHFEVLCRSMLHQRRLELEQELARKQEFRAERRATYQQARKSRQVVDTLREHQFQLYQQQQARREQRRLDDLFLLLRERRRG